VERLPDFPRSRAVLVGSARYQSPGLPDLEQVANNVSRLGALLAGPASGFASEHCALLVDPGSRDEVLAALSASAKQADDVLLFYFAGHGQLVGRQVELHLSLPNTDVDHPYTAVAYRDVAEIVMSAKATVKIVVLDCCYSGRATMATSDDLAAAIAHVDVEGTYVVASTSPTRPSIVEDDAEFTAFTGSLINIVENGDKEAAELLSMDHLYKAVATAMRKRNFPPPSQQNKNTAAGIALFRNATPTVTNMPAAAHATLNGLIQEISSLPNMQEPAQRERLVTGAGYGHLLAGLDQNRSPIGFAADLVHLLAAHDSRDLHAFLGNVIASAPMGQERRTALVQLHADLAALGDVVLTEANKFRTPVDLEVEAKISTQREIRVMGPRYHEQLYVPRLKLEADFDEFLSGDDTCFLVVSAAGRGKTNFLCRTAQRHGEQRPILLMAARFPMSNRHSLLDAVSFRLGFGDNWTSCFAALAEVADPTRTPLILLDALNEVPSPPPEVLEAVETLLIQAKRSGIKVAVTCRTEFWQFFRSAFWQEYTGGAETNSTRVYPLLPFAQEEFDSVASRYFQHYGIQGSLLAEARDQCRQPLALRLFCEAHHDRDVGVVTELRLYPLLKIFWDRKTEQIRASAELKYADAVTETVLRIAQRMLDKSATSLSRQDLLDCLDVDAQDLDSSTSLYGRAVDEEILIEERTDAAAGVRYVSFAFDQLAEFAFALSIYANNSWDSASDDEIVRKTHELIQNEGSFGSLRGALEFLVLRLEDRRPRDHVPFLLIDHMLNQGSRRWLQIGTSLAFRLDPAVESERFWTFVKSTLITQSECLPRQIVAEHVAAHTERYFDDVSFVLERLIADRTKSVRETAKQAVLRLPAELMVRMIERLMVVDSLQDKLVDIALYPIDCTSQLAHRKLEWLVSRGSEILPRQDFLATALERRAPLLDRLLDLEELHDTFLAIHHDNSFATDVGRWLSDVGRHRDDLAKVASNDLTMLSRILVLLQLAAENGATLTATGPVPWVDHEELRAQWNGLISSGIPEVADRQVFGPLEVGQNLGDWPIVDLMFAAYALPKATQLPYPDAGFDVYRIMVSEFSMDSQKDLSLLYAVATEVWQIAVTNWSRGTDKFLPINLLLGLGEPLRTNASAQDEEAVIVRKAASIQQDVSAAFGIPMSAVERRRLSTVGRLVLWCWERVRAHEQSHSRLASLRLEIEGASLAELLDRLHSFRDESPSAERRRELSDFLYASCGALLDRHRDLARLWSDYIDGHEQYGVILDDALDELHRRDYGAFWTVAQALLPRSSGRVSQAVNQAIERADHAELQEIDDSVLVDVIQLIEEITGVSRHEVAMDSRIIDDLDIDSLSMVELVMAVEAKFRIKIPDNYVQYLKTVGDLTNYVKERQDEARQPIPGLDADG
jgi:acyl carrier protein